MIWIAAVGGAILGGLFGWYIGYRIDQLRDVVDLNDKLRRNDARLASERWEVLQERHDIVIELIAQIAEARAPTPDPDDRTRRRARKKAKP